MAYSALTFTASEVPTLTKWNQLWANDAAMADGTGIANAAILNRHLSTTAVKVTNIDFSTWPAFLATPVAAQSLTGGAAAVAMVMDSEIYDQANNYNNASYVFTAPATGIYDFVLVGVATNGTSSRLNFSLKVNATFYNGSQLTDTFSSGMVFLQIKLTAGDTVQPYAAFNPATGSINPGVGNTRFYGKRVA